ncbi:hypothetical protein [Lentilactobacillus hilgardii]|uniref:hypothetical protein n=1 Tax=Lentilactobacillus hilgardii TaxID=1588 RepID=UPI0021A38003|nr:hypothetical protein [Lentilactobacillus hilgardii]MCT3399001.1 hypothetical protein [Lentilactobacillus hilgardii]
MKLSKVASLLSVAVLGVTLSACSNASSSKSSNYLAQHKTALKLKKLEKTGATPQASTNKNGSFNLEGETSPKAKLTAYIKNGSRREPLNLVKKSDGSFSKTIRMNKSTGQYKIVVVAKSPDDKKSSKKFYLLNNSSAFQEISEKEQSAQKRADKISAAKEKVRKAAESSRKAKEEKEGAALASSEEAASKDQNSTNNNPHTHGLSGLKYQADKYLKKDNSVAFYHPVKVSGYDDSKPYVANIEFKANNESKATMKDGAVSILEGVKKADYKDFSNIKISFTQNVSNANGKTLKNIPVLGYSFSRSTLESIDPNNMDSSDLSKVADSHFDKHVEDD